MTPRMERMRCYELCLESWWRVGPGPSIRKMGISKPQTLNPKPGASHKLLCRCQCVANPTPPPKAPKCLPESLFLSGCKGASVEGGAGHRERYAPAIRRGGPVGSLAYFGIGGPVGSLAYFGIHRLSVRMEVSEVGVDVSPFC